MISAPAEYRFFGLVNMSVKVRNVTRRVVYLASLVASDTGAIRLRCLGVSKDLVKSVETGRRRLTEHWEREIRRAFSGVHFGVQRLAPVQASFQQHVFRWINARESLT